MKAVLISIKPKWCELIANGKKTVEVRKTKPKIDVPFKCYIYCTKSRMPYESFGVNKQPVECGGKVIGEFVCDQIDEIGYSPEMHGQYVSNIENLHEVSCVNFEEMFDYIADGFGYGWNISNLVIYDKPKELSEFKPVKCEKNFDGECIYKGRCRHQVKCSTWGYRTFKCEKNITIAPQSWKFVEELGV